MKYFFPVFCFFSSITVFGQQMSSTDSSQIVSVINEWDQGWKIKDYTLASKGYGEDSRFTNAFGDKRVGQKAVEALLKEVFSLPFVMSGESQTAGHTFKVLRNDVIVVETLVVRLGQRLPDGSSISERMTTHLRVFNKSKNSWLIEAHLISDARDKQSGKQ